MANSPLLVRPLVSWRWSNTLLLPALLWLTLAADVSLGLIWALSDPNLFGTPAFQTAELVFPMRVHGLILVAVAVLALVSWTWRGMCWLLGYLVAFALGGLWTFWTVLFAWAALRQPPSSLTAGAFSTVLLVLHLLAGVAVKHHPIER